MAGCWPVFLLSGVLAAAPALAKDVRLNEIQVLGSHNSYHLQPGPSADDLLNSLGRTDLSIAWEYSHLPLERQLSEQGVRQIELDVFLDPEGGLYADPLIDTLIADNGLPPDPENDPEGVLLEPGFKVLHVQDLDFRSTCLTLADCLETVRDWSDEHPRHLPLMLLIELKDEPVEPAVYPFVIPPEYEAADMDDLDDLIRSIFPPERLLTPDDVRGDHATLEDAVLLEGWPKLKKLRGRVMFALDNGGRIRELYLEGHPSLRGRVLFTDSQPGDPEAAFMKRNDPLAGFDEIKELVESGYLVRTLADSNTVEARTGDTERRDAALASGAHFVSTDYMEPNPDFGTGYFVEIPGGTPARCNPISAPLDCKSEMLENLKKTKSGKKSKMKSSKAKSSKKSKTKSTKKSKTKGSKKSKTKKSAKKKSKKLRAG